MAAVGVNRRLQRGGLLREPRIAEQPPEEGRPQPPLADALVAVHPRASPLPRVVQVEAPEPVQAHHGIERDEGLIVGTLGRYAELPAAGSATGLRAP